jgi:hypothetical protein
MDLQFHPEIHDDGQRNCPEYAEFQFQNKFEELVHLVGFIIRKCVIIFALPKVKYIENA